LVTADSLFNSPSESLNDINLIDRTNEQVISHPLINTQTTSHIYYTKAKTRRKSSDDSNSPSSSSSSSSSSSGSSDTLVDGVSIASSCATYISQGGHGYKCARSNLAPVTSSSTKQPSKKQKHSLSSKQRKSDKKSSVNVQQVNSGSAYDSVLDEISLNDNNGQQQQHINKYGKHNFIFRNR